MGFYFNSTRDEVAKKPAKAKTLKRDRIPIQSLQSMGCSVCPRNADATKLAHPKMEATGVKRPSVYLLGTNPNEADDEAGEHWAGKMGDELYDKFGKAFMRNEVRSGYVTQCRGDQTLIEIECCRLRVVADIEATKPLVVVGIGDIPLNWATGITGGAFVHRGTMVPVRIGTHTCWYYSLAFPAYMGKNRFGTSEHELVSRNDINFIKDWVRVPTTPHVVTGPYDQGVELITGQEPGDMQRLEDAFHELAKAKNSAVDVETNGLRPHFMSNPHIWTVAVGTFNRTVAFPVDHPEGWGTQARQKRVMGLLGDYLMESGRKAAHHLAMELEWFNYFLGADVLRRTEWDDTMAIGHTLDERPGTKSLGHQTLITFGFDIKKQSNLEVTRLLDYPLTQVLRYNGMDTKWTDGLRAAKMPLVEANPKYLAEYNRKVRLAPTLVLTSAKGLPVDFKYAKQQGHQLEERLSKLSAQIQRCPEVKQYTTQFGTFSPTNPDHVLDLMRKVCERSEVRVEDPRTKAVTWTSGEDALSKIPPQEVPSAPLVLEHRGVAKLLSTYVQPILDRKIVCPDGYVRPTYGSMVAVTGRLNAEDPNIQNWPSRKSREIRGIICSLRNGGLMAMDYGQIEFRVVGMASEDPAIVKACWTGYDVHKHWAERLIDIYPQQKDYIVEAFSLDWDEKGLKTLRQEMKNMWVFPQLFGSSLRGCCDNLHLPDWVGQELYDEFWDEFSATKVWQDKLIKGYERNLYVETLGGRRRRGAMTKNELINMPIQGTAADIVLEAMCAVSELSYERDDPELQPALNVHDDLTFLVSDQTMTAKMDTIATEMCRHRFNYINVPLVVEAKIGVAWHELEEVKVYRSNELFKLKNPYQ